MSSKASFPIYSRLYHAEIHGQSGQDPDIPRFLVPCFVPNDKAFRLVHCCVAAVAEFTREPYELWLIDNASPPQWSERLLELSDNIVFNRTSPGGGSLANAVGLELGIRQLPPATRHVVAMHSDTMPAHDNWWPYLRSKLSERVRVAGTRLEQARVPEGVIHPLCCLLDYRLFQELRLDFQPDLPRLDVCDRVTVELRKHGYDAFACRTTSRFPELLSLIPPGSPLRRYHVERAFDDDDNVVHLNLGRGTSKCLTNRSHTGAPWRTTVEQWFELAAWLLN